MFVSHKQFQHGRVWCQDNSHIICHCRMSTGLARKVRFFFLELPTSTCVLAIVSPQHAVLFFGNWPSLPWLFVISVYPQWNEFFRRVGIGRRWGKNFAGERRWSSDLLQPLNGENPRRWFDVATRSPWLFPVVFFFNGYGLRYNVLPPFT